MPGMGGFLQRKCACGGTPGQTGECEACRKKKLQRLAGNSPASSSIDGSSSSVSEVPPIVHEVLRSPGQPLDPEVRAFMEPRFGHDFTNVRVHANASAAESARAVNARAYSVENNVVFGAGGFQPHTAGGRELLAHELTHVVQQSRGAHLATSSRAIDPDPALEAEAESVGHGIHGDGSFKTRPAVSSALQRKPAGGSGKKARPPHIIEVQVNQNTSQQVKAVFSDGTTEIGECSTGKGHCCFDESAGTAEGGACSASRSKQVGNNCTPVGDFKVTAKVPQTAGGVRLWTQFHDAKSVALHEYAPVDGTPLSHGCVRMHTAMAQTIFDGARVGVTRVKVEGLAKPLCKHGPLQTEWQDDFALAGTTPPDGEATDPFTGKRLSKKEIAQERKHIKGARKELRSALGVDEAGLDTELAAVRGGADAVSKIPRCLPALTVEEQRVPAAQKEGFLGSSSSATTAAFSKALRKTRASTQAEKVVRLFGEKLWEDAKIAARSGGPGTDDRQLYWTRLMLTTELRQWNPSWSADADALRRLQGRLLSVLEQSSRGFTTSAFPADPDLKRILVSGFDPFGFANSSGDIRQSNVSGATAISLDGETLADGKVSARIEGVVFPTRYADFNEGIVENHLRPHLAGPQPPHLVMSISQGGSLFEFEEWAGRRRGGPTTAHTDYAENLGRQSGATPTSPVEPPGLATGPEFLPHSVPPSMLKDMRGAVGRTSAIAEETDVFDLPSGAPYPRKLKGGPGPGSGTSVEGAGGGFLSNEIFYRNSLVRTQTGSSVPLIHLHTPKVPPGADDAIRNAVIDTIRKILLATLPHL